MPRQALVGHDRAAVMSLRASCRACGRDFGLIFDQGDSLLKVGAGDGMDGERASDDRAHQGDLARLLAWTAAMGADAVLGEIAIDWQSRGDDPPLPVSRLLHTRMDVGSSSRAAEPPQRIEPVARIAPAASPAAARTAASAPPPAPMLAEGEDDAHALDLARRLAAQAGTLEALEAALRDFTGCPLHKTAKNLCFMRGAARSRLMLVGEGPGREEDETGRPFVGRAGRLLDKMLAAIGLGEDSVHITNVVYWRPPGNRAPTPHELAVCQPFLERQIALVDPDVVVALGGSSAKALLATDSGIMRTRGRWHDRPFGGRTRRTIAMLHPAYLLRTPAAKRMAWQDLLAIKLALEA